MYNNEFVPMPEVVNFNYFNRLSNIEQLLKRISMDVRKIEQKLNNLTKEKNYDKDGFNDDSGMYMM